MKNTIKEVKAKNDRGSIENEYREGKMKQTCRNRNERERKYNTDKHPE